MYIRKKSIRTWLLIAMGVIMVSFASGAMGVFVTARMILGDGTPALLRIWDFVDGTGEPPLYVGKTATVEDPHGSTFYTLIPPGENLITGPFAAMVRQEGSGYGVGATFYAEHEGEGGTVWGVNSIALSYNGRPAVGMEVNGGNMSDDFALVRGIDIVNGGFAPTEYGLGIMTSNDFPVGKPRYGIVLGGPGYAGYLGTTPASHTGILIDHIDSGEAIRIAQGDHITLDGRNGRIRLRYNPDTETIEFLNGNRVVHAIPM